MQLSVKHKQKLNREIKVCREVLLGVLELEACSAERLGLGSVSSSTSGFASLSRP